MIYGLGNMAENYGDGGADQPWKDKKDLTTTVRIEYGIIKTEKGNGANVRSGPGTEKYEKLFEEYVAVHDALMPIYRAR